MKTVRIWFQKTGAARFISHLDLAHCMARALHRARVPLWYTQGYNPRPHMVFALPLPLGVTGLRECVDIKIDEEAITEEELARRLSEALPAALPVLAVTEPQEKPGKITWASYTLLLEPEEGTAEELLEKNPDICVVTNELGYGVVPADAFDRKYREATGRICEKLAAGSDEVHRVICGIGTVIKRA